MKFLKTNFKDLVVIEKDTFHDSRGYFRELYLDKHFTKKFPFDVMSLSKKKREQYVVLVLNDVKLKFSDLTWACLQRIYT